MFDKQIRLTGIHADYIRKYSKDKQGENAAFFTLDNNEGKTDNYYLFDSILQCYMCSAMIGIINNRTAPVDNTKTTPANIFAEIINKNRNNLERIYHHMVIATYTDLSVDSRIKKAFSVNKENESVEEERLNAFVRGGLEIINEKFSNCKTFEDVANAVYELTTEYSL